MDVRDRTAGGAKHWTALDGLRGLAACVVVAFHGVTFSAFWHVWLDQRGGPLRLLVNSQLAVETFFVLSGFVLAGSLARQGSALELPQFYLRRIFRIHPPYVAAVFLAWCLSFAYAPLLSGAGPIAQRFARIHLAPGELLRTLSFPGTAGLQLPVGWTLEIEMVFSLLLPGMWLLARRVHWAALVAPCAAFLLFLGPGDARVLRFAIDFALGIALFCERERLSSWFARASRARIALWTLGFFAIGSVPCLLGWERSFVGRSAPATLVLQAIGAAGITAAAAFAAPISRALAHRAFRFLGRVSYSLYLVHFPVAVLLASRAPRLLGFAGDLLVPAAVFALSIPLAALGYRAIERPAIDAGNRLCRALAHTTGADAVVSRLGAPSEP